MTAIEAREQCRAIAQALVRLGATRDIESIAKSARLSFAAVRQRLCTNGPNCHEPRFRMFRLTPTGAWSVTEAGAKLAEEDA